VLVASSPPPAGWSFSRPVGGLTSVVGCVFSFSGTSGFLGRKGLRVNGLRGVVKTRRSKEKGSPRASKEKDPIKAFFKQVSEILSDISSALLLNIIKPSTT
jgi:hypothetical protein